MFDFNGIGSSGFQFIAGIIVSLGVGGGIYGFATSHLFKQTIIQVDAQKMLLDCISLWDEPYNSTKIAEFKNELREKKGKILSSDIQLNAFVDSFSNNKAKLGSYDSLQMCNKELNKKHQYYSY